MVYLDYEEFVDAFRLCLYNGSTHGLWEKNPRRFSASATETDFTRPAPPISSRRQKQWHATFRLWR